MTPQGPTNPSPGDYNYVLANTVPGWAAFLANPNFNSMIGNTVAFLTQLIIQALPDANPNGGANPLVGNQITSGDGFVSIDITFQQNRSVADIATLTACVNRMLDYFIITDDGGVTDLGNPATITQPAGPTSATTITLQCKQGDGTNRTGVSDAVVLTPSALMPIDKISGSIDPNTGQFAFTVGASLQKGAVQISIAIGLLTPRQLTTAWDA